MKKNFMILTSEINFLNSSLLASHQTPCFSFALKYAAKTINCEVRMQPESYEILFDSRRMGSIAYTDDWTWIQAFGVILPDAIIDEIGFRVESEYN